MLQYVSTPTMLSGSFVCVCAHTCVCIVHLHQVSTLAVIHGVCTDLHDYETSHVGEGVSTPGVPPGQTREHRDEQQLTHCLKSTSQQSLAQRLQHLKHDR